MSRQSAQKKARRYSFTTVSEAAKDVQGTELIADISRPKPRNRKRPRSPEHRDWDRDDTSPSKRSRHRATTYNLPTGT